MKKDINSTIYTVSNDPNPGRLIESLRCLGYDNYVAIADLVDNCIDAEANLVRIKVWQERGDFRIAIGDNGSGMDKDTLDEALKLGSLTVKNPVSDLGKFGMGLVTASLSLARKTTVISKMSGKFCTSISDIDEVISRNRFCKYLDESTDEEIEIFNTFVPDAQAGTLVLLDKCDGIKNLHTTNFANTLKKHLGRVHRHFLRANLKVTVNGQEIEAVDPLELDNSDTEIFSDEVYPVKINLNGSSRVENVHVKITLISENAAAGERDITLSLKNQGFYVLRNNREIIAASTLDAFSKHNDFNRMRGEVFLSGEIDSVVGIDFTKRDIVLDQSFKDQLVMYLKGQCTTIKRRESSKSRVKESDEVVELHEQAQKAIDQKSKLLITPSAPKEKRTPRQKKSPHIQGEGGNEGSILMRQNFRKTQPGNVHRCRFQYAKLGSNGQIYECDLEGRIVVITWNIDHPFYQRFVLDQRSDGRLVTAVDYLIFSMASAELTLLNDDNIDLLNSLKSIISSNTRTLLI